MQLSSKIDDATKSSPPQFAPNKRETMCSIQDLLANTSDQIIYNSDNAEKRISAEESHSLNLDRISKITHSLKAQSQMSINEVGLPLQGNEDESSARPHHHDLTNGDQNRSHQSSLGEMASKSEINEEQRDKDCFLKGGVQSHSAIVNTITSISKNDYENTYNALPGGIPSLFAPKSLFVLETANQSVAGQSCVSHDYENCPAINVYRANTGVRHWKPYFNIADKIHDYSTFKERSFIQDSTLSSNLYANTLILSDLSPRPLSMAEKANSNYSVSLPDLTTVESTLELERIANFPEETPFQDDNKPTERTHFVNGTNYEAIWYDGDEAESPRFTNEKDANAKESMCNLYYSRLSQLSSHYRIKRNSSLNSLAYKDPVNNFYLSNPQFVLEIKNGSEADAPSNTEKMSTPNNKCKIFDSKRTEKSPLMKLVSLSQNSLHEHTLRALQAGRRVFYRPRVHVITPKKGTLIESHKAKTINEPRLEIDPQVLKKRGHLSPKNKLILSEASALIHGRESASTCKVALGFATEAVHCEKDDGNENHLPGKDEDGEKEGPQHSTPEGNRHHLPQMSILSTISSVASPEEMRKLDHQEFLFKKKSTSVEELPGGSSSLLLGGRRCSSKRLAEMSVIEEFESVPSQV